QKVLLMQVENAIGIAKSSLNNLLGRGPEQSFQVSEAIVPDASVNFDRYRQKARDDNFDIMLARSNLAVLLQEKREIMAQRLPAITLNGNYNFTQSRNDAGFNLFNRNTGPNANIGIAIPLFNGGNVTRQQKVADINIANQQVTMKQVENQVQTNLLNAYLRYQNALNMASLEKTTLELIQENNTIATERFKKLAITSLELRQVQIDYINSQTRYINTLFMAKLAETEMKLLAGELGNL
ncbi:MAG: TolC family protein, partial [Chitinophagaceae bacterium]